ncbi:MAG: ROK family protein [Acidobacteria bacterium]|nr:MAG: ROK family protein [Acidobacteriota bacterium]
MGRYILGIDLGGTKVMAAVLDPAGLIVSRARAKTRGWRNDEEVFVTIAGVAREAMEEAGVDQDQLAAVGIGAPGPIDFDTGYVIETANLRFKNFPLGPRVAEEFGRPTIIENDVNAGMYGEFKAGAALGVSEVLGVFVGTGIGGGLILNGALYRGFNKGAGEIGHIIVKAGGPRCGCGNRGCLEAVASRTAITREIRKAIKRGKHSVVSKKVARKNEILSGQDLKEAYDADDEVVRKIVHRAAQFIGIGIGSLLNVLGSEMVVLGGGVVEAFGDDIVDRIERAARRTAFEINSRDVRIIRAQLGDDAGVIGAAALAREALVSNVESELV